MTHIQKKDLRFRTEHLKDLKSTGNSAHTDKASTEKDGKPMTRIITREKLISCIITEV